MQVQIIYGVSRGLFWLHVPSSKKNKLAKLKYLNCESVIWKRTVIDDWPPVGLNCIDTKLLLLSYCCVLESAVVFNVIIYI